jgi:hypothetical protein
VRLKFGQISDFLTVHLIIVREYCPMERLMEETPKSPLSGGLVI